MTQVYEYKQKLYNQRRAQYIINKIKQLRQHATCQQYQWNMNYMDRSGERDNGRVQEVYAKNNYSSRLHCESINEQLQPICAHPDSSLIANSIVVRQIQSYIGSHTQGNNLKQSIISSSNQQNSIDYYQIYQYLQQNITSMSNNCQHVNMQMICEVVTNLCAHIINDSDARTEFIESSQREQWSAKSVYFECCTFACFLISLLGSHESKLMQNEENIGKLQKQVIQALYKCMQLNQPILNSIITQLLIRIYKMKPALLSAKYMKKQKVIHLLQDLLLSITEIVPQKKVKQGKIQQYEIYVYKPQVEQQVMIQSNEQLAIVILDSIDINALEQSLNNGLFDKIVQASDGVVRACMQRVRTISNKQLQKIINQSWRQAGHNDESQIQI